MEDFGGRTGYRIEEKYINRKLNLLGTPLLPSSFSVDWIPTKLLA